MSEFNLQTLVEGIFTLSPFLGFFQLLELLAQFLNAIIGGLGGSLRFVAL